MGVEYKGYKIDINSQYRFKVTGPDFEKDHDFPSLDSAKNAIEQTVKAKAKATKLALEIMDANGKEYVITGINLHTRNFTTKPLTHESYSYSGNDEGIPSNAFYPRSEKAKSLITEVRKLQKQLVKKQTELATMQIKYDRGGVNVDNMGDKMEALVDEYEDAKKNAE